jgi:hypothetical protein
MAAARGAREGLTASPLALVEDVEAPPWG